MFLSIQNYKDGRYCLSAADRIQEFNQPITKKWLHGDILDPDTKNTTERNKKAHKAIVGIVDFMNRIRIGMTPRGVPLYNFHPYDPGYPTMVVSSKLTPTTNMVAIASLEHWDLNVPRAGLQHVFGPVGNIKAEISALKMGINVPRQIYTDELSPNTHIHDRSPWDVVFNIDPEGCQDVDDVMGWRKVPNGIDFFIGIVDIASWIPEGSDWDRDAYATAQTLYMDGVAEEPMFPDEISTQKASLRADGVKRPVLALLYRFRTDGSVDESMNPFWVLLMVSVTKAYTYESVLQDPEIPTTLPPILAKLTGLPQSDDPHIWVEQAMILYNTEAATRLSKAKVGVLRKHTGISKPALTALAESTGVKELAYLGSASGQYISAKESDTAHAGLNVSHYCHASSPLRRYADVVNHRWIRHVVFGCQAPQIPVEPEHLNHRATIIKQFERTLWFLRAIQPDTITTAKGYVITIDPETKDAKVYIPEWRRTIKAGHVTNHIYKPGDHVGIRAFTNLKATSLHKRVVCSLLGLRGSSPER
jgi:exoribonuclease R